MGTLASTLSSVRPELVAGMAVILGVDKFMAECRSLTNLIGNAIACVVIAASEGDLDRGALCEKLGVAQREEAWEKAAGREAGEDLEQPHSPNPFSPASTGSWPSADRSRTSSATPSLAS